MQFGIKNLKKKAKDVQLHKSIGTLLTMAQKCDEWPNLFATVVANVELLLDIALLSSSSLNCFV